MAFPYRLYGGATRPDAISGLDPAFSGALLNLYNAAPPEVQRELGLTSAYRSIARQTQLFNASDRSGKMVAPPGKSRHNFGQAADLYGFGLKGAGDVSQGTKDWVHGNAGQYGLAFPMSYEPWHIQMARSQGQAGPGAARAGGGAPDGQGSSSPVGEIQPPPMEMPTNPIANAIFGAQGDWMKNTSYSTDAVASDFFAGRNPVRRFMYQKLMSMFV